MRWRGREVLAAAEDEAWRTLTDGAERILNASKAIVPHDEGTLERSGKIDRKRAQKEILINFGAGGAGGDKNPEAYAVIQHEGHFNHPKGRQRKYLEKPFNQMKDGIIEKAQREMRSGLRRRP